VELRTSIVVAFVRRPTPVWSYGTPTPVVLMRSPSVVISSKRLPLVMKRCSLAGSNATSKPLSVSFFSKPFTVQRSIPLPYPLAT
jgi:hypothetical protein